MDEIEFTVKFRHFGQSAEDMICDFCEQRPVEWYNEFLVTGWCKQCMDEQKQEYEKQGGT